MKLYFSTDVSGGQFKTADYLTRRGDFGIFSPMYMILYKKPHDKDEQIECFIGKLEN